MAYRLSYDRKVRTLSDDTEMDLLIIVQTFSRQPRSRTRLLAKKSHVSSYYVAITCFLRNRYLCLKKLEKKKKKKENNRTRSFVTNGRIICLWLFRRNTLEHRHDSFFLFIFIYWNSQFVQFGHLVEFFNSYINMLVATPSGVSSSRWQRHDSWQLSYSMIQLQLEIERCNEQDELTNELVWKS